MKVEERRGEERRGGRERGREWEIVHEEGEKGERREERGGR